MVCNEGKIGGVCVVMSWSYGLCCCHNWQVTPLSNLRGKSWQTEEGSVWLGLDCCGPDAARRVEHGHEPGQRDDLQGHRFLPIPGPPSSRKAPVNKPGHIIATGVWRKETTRADDGPPGLFVRNFPPLNDGRRRIDPPGARRKVVFGSSVQARISYSMRLPNVGAEPAG